MDKKYFRTLLIGWTSVILFLLLSDGSQEPSFFSQIPNFDKLIHFSIFMIWAMLIRLSSIRMSDPIMLIVLVLFAGLTEYLQRFALYRAPDVFDAIVDVIGGLIGYYVIKYLKKS